MINVIEVLRNRVVQASILSLIFLHIGTWVRNLSILLFVVKKTNSDPLAVSMISVAQYAPIFLLSFIGGTFADRWRPRRTIILCDYLSALSIFVVLFTLIYGTWHTVFFATLISAILSQFSQPAGMKLFKLHVPDELLQTGMTIYQTISATFIIFGPALGTFIYQSFGIEISIALMGLAFIFSGTAMFLVPKDPEIEIKEHSSIYREMISGIRYVFSKKTLYLLCSSFGVTGLALGLIQPLYVFYIQERLGLAEDFLQWFLMTNGIGIILGGALALGLSKKVIPQRLLVIGFMVSAVAIILLGFTTNVWMALVLEFVIGIVTPFIQIGINTLVLRQTESEYMGRVNGILMLMFTGSMVLAMGLAGILKQTLSLVWTFEIAGCLFLIGAFVAFPLFLMGKSSQSAMDQTA